MARSNGYGIVALHDDKESNHGFFCMKLAEYISKEIPIGDNLYGPLWHTRFAQAKAGKCGRIAPYILNQNRRFNERESKDNPPSRKCRCGSVQRPVG